LPGDIRRILVVRVDHIGDMVLSTPAFRALKHAFPQAHLTLLARPETAELMHTNPNLDEIITFSPQLFARSGERIPSAEETLELLARLKKRGFDLAIDLRGERLTTLLAALSGARVVVSPDFGDTGLATVKVPSTSPYNFDERRHQVDINLDALRALGIEPFKGGLEINLVEEDRNRACELLRKHQLHRHPFLAGLHVGGGYPSKLWTVSGFAEIGDRLVREYGAGVVITGSAADLKRAARVASLMEYPCTVLAGQTNLREVAALLETFRIFVSGDCGLMHIASAVGTRTVGIFGGVNIVERWRPYQGEYAVVRYEPECSPCHQGVCPRGVNCMGKITARDVWREVSALLKKGGREE